ncbi:MAG: Gfo/Idh/MocA family oxidoreductase, partial [Terracidiphilus sp.]
MTDIPRSIRWGVIGPGRAASRFAHGLEAVKQATIAAVWGRNPEGTRSYADRFSVPTIAPTLDALLSSDIDAVYIAT